MSNQVQIHMRLSKKTVDEIDKLAKEYSVPRIAMLKILLKEGIDGRRSTKATRHQCR
jgi:hypothetical protein